jgi:hypothetical protein
MAALTNNYRTNDKAGDVIAYNVQANVQVWQGALTVIDTATGLLEPATDATGKVFCGVAFEPTNNVGGAAGANSGRVQKSGTFVYGYQGSTPVQATVGTKAYIYDDNNVAASGGTSHTVWCGVVVGLVDGGSVRVKIDQAVLA